MKDGKIEIWMDAGCNDLFGNYIESGNLKEAYLVKRPLICVITIMISLY